MACLHGDVRPQMVRALHRIRGAGIPQALLTNNVVSSGGHRQGTGGRDEVLALFDVIVESSVVGIRKPEVRFYEIACEQLAITPHDAVFRDDPRHQPEAGRRRWAWRRSRSSTPTTPCASSRATSASSCSAERRLPPPGLIAPIPAPHRFLMLRAERVDQEVVSCRTAQRT